MRKDYMVVTDNDEYMFNTLKEAKAFAKEKKNCTIRRWVDVVDGYKYDEMQYDESYMLEFKDGKEIKQEKPVKKIRL